MHSCPSLSAGSTSPGTSRQVTWTNTIRLAREEVGFGPLIPGQRPACEVDWMAEMSLAALSGKGIKRVVAMAQAVMEGVEQNVLSEDDIPDIEAMAGGLQLPMPVYAWNDRLGRVLVSLTFKSGRRIPPEQLQRRRAEAEKAKLLVAKNRRVWLWLCSYESNPMPSYVGFVPYTGWDATCDGWREIARAGLDLGDLVISPVIPSGLVIADS